MKKITRRRNINRTGILNVVRKKRRNNNRQVITTSQLPRMVLKNLHSGLSRSGIKTTTSIGTLIGSSQWLFGATGTNYWNIAQILAANQVFTDSLAKYTMFRITGVSMDIQRQLPETGTVMTGIFSNGTIPPLFGIFTPTYTSTGAITSLPACGASIEFDPFVQERQRGKWNFSPIMAYHNGSTGIGTQHLYGMWNILENSYTGMPGSVQIYPPASFALAALTTTVFWTCTVTVDIEFSCDYA